jgi:hypothetical protein
LLKEGGLLVFEWRFLIDPEQSLSVTHSTEAQGMLPGKNNSVRVDSDRVVSSWCTTKISLYFRERLSRLIAAGKIIKYNYILGYTTGFLNLSARPSRSVEGGKGTI